MGFINNTSYILNAVLTKKGKQYLSKSDGKFNITKFALSDDEIDYTLWDTAHPLGSSYYGAVLESTPMLEPCMDPEVVMKYKLITIPVGSKSLPYISNVTPLSGLLGTNALQTTYNSTLQEPYSLNDHTINPKTEGVDGTFSHEDYSFLVLNKNVVDIGVGQGDNLNFNVGAVYGEESGRLSKKVVGRTATLRTAIGTVGTERETSIIVTGQMSGAIFVIPVKVKYVDNSPSGS